MKKRLWQRVGIGLIVVNVGLLIWIVANPTAATTGYPRLTVGGAIVWGLVLLLYGLAGFVWGTVGIFYLLKKWLSRNRSPDGPEADYDDRPPGS